MEELLKLIQQLGRKHDNLIVFQDFIQLMTCAISKPFINREDRYFAVYSRYTDDEMLVFTQMGKCLLDLLEEEPRDVLGHCYMQLRIANTQLEQYFTPPSIAKVMASILFCQEIEQHGYFTLNEPTCGSGALIIAFCETMRKQGFNPQAQLRVFSQDIDLKSVQMCFVQLSLLGIPAVIAHANPLTNEVMDQYITPFYYLRGNKNATTHPTNRTMGRRP